MMTLGSNKKTKVCVCVCWQSCRSCDAAHTPHAGVGGRCRSRRHTHSVTAPPCYELSAGSRFTSPPRGRPELPDGPKRTRLRVVKYLSSVASAMSLLSRETRLFTSAVH